MPSYDEISIAISYALMAVSGDKPAATAVAKAAEPVKSAAAVATKPAAKAADDGFDNLFEADEDDATEEEKAATKARLGRLISLSIFP
jgi:hypothetical protein